MMTVSIRNVLFRCKRVTCPGVRSDLHPVFEAGVFRDGAVEEFIAFLRFEVLATAAFGVLFLRHALPLLVDRDLSYRLVHGQLVCENIIASISNPDQYYARSCITSPCIAIMNDGAIVFRPVVVLSP